MTKRTFPELQKVATALRQALLIIERFEKMSDRRNLPDQILDVLEVGPASTNTVRDLVRRKSGDVRATLKILAEASLEVAWLLILWQTSPEFLEEQFIGD